MKKPYVTIYIPTYNRLPLLRRAVFSVIKQSYSDWELIIVDDNSQDDTVLFIEGMSRIDNRIRWFVNAKNSGACYSRNKAISEARGTLITGLDDDDYLSERHIESLITAWNNKEDDIVAVYPNVIRCYGSIQKQASKKLSYCDARSLILSNWIGNQILTRVDILSRIGGFDEVLPAWQDYECWYRLLKTTGMRASCSGMYTYYVDSSHAFYRISDSPSDKILFSWGYFCKKHNLKSDESEIAKLMLSFYGIKDLKIRYIIRKTYMMPCLKNMKNSLLIILKYFGFF